MSFHRLLLMTVLLLASVVEAEPRGGRAGYAIARSRGAKSAVEVGDLVMFDLALPSEGRVVGNTGLTDVASMDFLGDELWVATFRDDKLAMYTVNLETAEATPRSTVAGSFSGVSGGGFDELGRYWIANMRENKLLAIDPHTGEVLAKAKFPTSAGYNGLAFVGERLHALRGGTGDPPQEFGTLDTATGEFLPVGYTNVGVEGKGGGNGCGALDFDPTTQRLYAVYRQGIERSQLWSLYTIDAATGHATFLGEIQPRAIYDAFAVAPSKNRRR